MNFTDEEKDIKIDANTEKFFKNVIKRMRAFDMFAIKKYHQKDIDAYFKEIDEKYDGKNYFEDTRDLIKTEVEDLLENGIIYSK